ncbi:MAG TPA: YbaB/EbfC family nucleoid-associated protein [Acidobacteriota bacterium]|nr:YbaB/EbfC family nucleoid-associated protein [Acidobacteriota bacterium]
MKNLQKMMKQAQQMQERMQKAMEDLEVAGSAGGGMVTARMNGNKQLLELTLDPEVVDPEDIEMLQDMIVAAINDAARRVDEALQEQMQGLTGGMPLPGMF